MYILAGVVISALVIYLAHNSIVERRNIRLAQANAQVRQVASAVAARVGAEVETVRVVLRAIAATLEEEGTPDGLVTRVVKESGSRLQSLRAIIVADSSGVVVADSRAGDPALGGDIRDRRYFRVHQDREVDGLYIGRPVKSRVEGRWVPPISVGVVDSSGAFAGIVAASVDPGAWAEIMSLSPGLHGLLARVTLDSAVLVVAPVDEGGDRYPAEEATNRAIERLIGDLSYSVPVLGYPLTVTVAGTVGAYLGEFDRFRERVVIAGGSVLALVWLSIFGANYLQNRFRVEAETARLQRDQLAEANEQLSHEMAQRITAQHEAENARAAAVEASQAKSRFLAAMSHELRTPLNSIIGYSDMVLLETFGPIGNRRYLEYLKDIHASGHHLLSLIDDILDLSKLQASDKFSLAPVSVSDVVAAAVELAGLRDDPRLDVSVADGLTLLADERALKQVLVNLLANADRHGEGATRIRVACSVEPDDRICLTVEDDGVGIDGETLMRIGQPFERSVKSAFNASRVHGLGIGLSIVARLVELMRGTWSIASESGSGTCVQVFLTRARP